MADRDKDGKEGQRLLAGSKDHEEGRRLAAVLCIFPSFTPRSD